MRLRRGPHCYKCGGESEIYADGPNNFLAQCFVCQLVMSLPPLMLEALFVHHEEYDKEMRAKHLLDLQQRYPDSFENQEDDNNENQEDEQRLQEEILLTALLEEEENEMMTIEIRVKLNDNSGFWIESIESSILPRIDDQFNYSYTDETDNQQTLALRILSVLWEHSDDKYSSLTINLITQPWDAEEQKKALELEILIEKKKRQKYDEMKKRQELANETKEATKDGDFPF